MSSSTLCPEKAIKVCVPDMKAKRVAVSGSGHLVAVDKDDDLSAVLVNPLTRKTTTLPRLSESIFHDKGAHGWVAGEGAIIVMLSNWLSEHAALWYHGGGINMNRWAVVSQRKLRLRMTYYMQMLGAHGDQMQKNLTEVDGGDEDAIVLQQFTQKVEENVLVHDIGDAVVVQSRTNCTCTYMIPGSRDLPHSVTFMKRLPEDWKLSDEWFMPTLK
uniref:F-box associated domain-containing protein n=1 Tax=Leersia perrieri TaxID=77586 RepID=A0A0D9V1N4_9ORYZ